MNNTDLPNSSLLEKSFRVLEILSQEDGLSQRHVALKAGLSLGMVNLTLKRLIKTGCIKVAALNSRKMEYILTPKGMAERMARSYTYLLRAYHTYQEAQRRVDGLLASLLAKGNRDFVIIGQGEIPAIIEMSLRRVGGESVEIRRVLSPERINVGRSSAIVLDCRLDCYESMGISVLETILGISRNAEPRAAKGPLLTEAVNPR